MPQGINTNTHTGPSFSLQNRLARFSWNIVYLLLFFISPRPFHKWRIFLLKIFGAQVDWTCRIYPKAKIWAPWNLICEEHSCIGDSATLYNQNTITLGAFSVVSQGCHLCTGTHDYTDPNFPLISHPITLGPRCWIAADAFIGPGVNIGEGCVIGARSVAVKDVSPWSVCAGNPCKFIKKREFRS